MRTPCTICDAPSIGRALCKKHYRAFMKYGDALESANLRGVPFHLRYQIDNQTGCWIWVGSTVTSGYGVWFAHGERTAHRGSWVLHNGAIPPGMHVLHDCDRPECVNPAHLRLGTHQDNMRDLRERGRAYGAKGEANFGARLTESQAMNIMADSRSCTVIARQYGITRESVDNIRNGRTWSHLFDEDVKAKRLATGPKRLSPVERQHIVSDTRKQSDIAAAYGVSQGFVSAIKRRHGK